MIAGMESKKEKRPDRPLCRPHNGHFEMEDLEFWFQYVSDPDGIPVETIAAIPKAK